MKSDNNIGMKCVKYMLFVASFMFLLVSLILISIGVSARTIYKDFDEFIDGQYYSHVNMVEAIGFLLLVVSFFGCVGALKESTCLVNLYAIFLAVILVLEVSSYIFIYAISRPTEENIRFNMETTISKYDQEKYQRAWNGTQEILQCCGVDGPLDWLEMAEFVPDPFEEVVLKNNTVLTVPESCCVDSDCSSRSVYARGCLKRLSYIVSECALLLAVGAFCVSFIQILGIIFAHMLAKSIRKLKTQALVEREQRRQQLYEQLSKQSNENEQKSTIMFTTPGTSDA